MIKLDDETGRIVIEALKEEGYTKEEIERMARIESRTMALVKRVVKKTLQLTGKDI